MNSRQQFEHRANTQIISLSDVTQDFFEPEHLRLKLSDRVIKKPIDIGCWAYFYRGKNESLNDDRGTPVVLDSFVESRRELIVKVLASFFGLRDASVRTQIRHMEYFINWLNLNNYREVFSGEADAQRAYRDYTANLNHQIAHRKLKPITAYAYQEVAAKVIELLYPESGHHILSSAVRITRERGSVAASSVHISLYRDVCLAVAQQCSDFVMNNKPYPWVVKIRDYEVVLFPSNSGAVGPFKNSPPPYNAAERRIATVEEYCASCDRLDRKWRYKSEVAHNIEGARASLKAANEDERHWHRFYMAGLAAKAFACLFLMITGATPTEFAQFSYEDALDVEKSPIKKELSAFKFRAGGKSTVYNIGRDTGLPLFKQYLKLREWILNGVAHERLFFSMPEISQPKNRAKVFTELNVSGVIRKLHDVISGAFLDPTVPRLTPRKMRKNKSNGMHSARVAPSTVAASLNHTTAVNLSTYAEATPEQQEAEFSHFWQAMRHAALVVRDRSQAAARDVTATGAGHCDGFNHPTAARDLGAVAIEPSCRTQYGCLYCEHYVCHSDKKDLHKLLSLQYVINAVRKVAPDAAHAEALYKELSIRIEFILDALGERSNEAKQLVETIRAKVFEYGELTAFWEARLSRYEKMGVVF